MHILSSALSVDLQNIGFALPYMELFDLLRGNALLRGKPGSDCGDDGGAVAAAVSGRQGQEGGGEDECLHGGGQHHIILLQSLMGHL